MAGRYATALYELAVEAKAVDTVQKDLMELDGMIAGNTDLQRLVKSPVFSSDEQTRAIGAVLDAAEITGLTSNFVRLVASNRRLFALGEMTRGFNAMVAKARGETTAEVVSAEALSATHASALRSALKSMTGKDVALKTAVDPGLIGGLTVKIGSRMIDASLKTKLQSIKIAMKEVG